MESRIVNTYQWVKLCGRQMRTVAVCALFALAAGSCKQSPISEQGVEPDQDKKFTSMTVELDVPGEESSLLTSAESEKDQNKIVTAAIVQFKGNMVVAVVNCTVNNEQGKYYITGDNLMTSRQDDDLYDIMVIANHGGMYMDFTSKSKEEVQRDLKFAHQEQGVTEGNEMPEWLKTNGMPMWGEAKDCIIRSTGTQKIKISMVRAHARIDVHLGTYDPLTKEWSGLKNFKITKVYVKNAMTTGMFVPLRNRFDYNTTTPSIPSPMKTYENMIEYENVGDDAQKSKGMTYPIFVPEVDYTDPNQRISLIIEAQYIIDGHMGTHTGYYRVDMSLKEDAVPSFHLLRNHVYSVAIKSLSSGYPDAYSAYLGGPGMHTKVEINPSQEPDLGSFDMIFDNNYYMRLNWNCRATTTVGSDWSNITISKSDIDRGPYNLLRLQTTFPAGVSPTVRAVVSGSGASVKIALKPEAGNTPTFMDQTLSIESVSKVEVCYIYITSGQLRWTLCIRIE